MKEPLKKDAVFECPFCHEKCISVWKKVSILGLSHVSKCPECHAILQCKKTVHTVRLAIVIILFLLGLQYIKLFPTGSVFISSGIFMAIFSICELIIVRLTKLYYLPDGKHPERIFKKEVQTLYGTMLFYVEDNVLYEQEYVIRVINQEQEGEFRILKEGYKPENVIDMVYNDETQSVFRIFNHYVTLRVNEMTISERFNIN